MQYVTPEQAHEIAERGQKLYDEQIKPLIETPANRGKLLCLDVETGQYEMGSDSYTLAKKVQAGRPDALLYTVRVGYAAAFSRGVRRSHPTKLTRISA